MQLTRTRMKSDTETPDVEEDVIVAPVEPGVLPVTDHQKAVEAWTPKTALGKKVKAGAITTIDEVLDNHVSIFEAQIVDALLPQLETDLLLIGQAKGKFGGGQRRVFRQTQKKTAEGN